LLHRFPYFQDGTQPYPGLEIELASPIPPHATTPILGKIDCGSDRTVLPDSLVDDLGLIIVGYREFEGVDGFHIRFPLARVTIRIGNLPELKIEAAVSNGESIALLGLDVLNHFLINLDGPNQTLEIG
jgi:hypothetical protein